MLDSRWISCMAILNKNRFTMPNLNHVSQMALHNAVCGMLEFADFIVSIVPCVFVKFLPE